MEPIIIIVDAAEADFVTAAPTLMPTPTPTAAPTLPGKFLIWMHDHIWKQFVEWILVQEKSSDSSRSQIK